MALLVGRGRRCCGFDDDGAGGGGGEAVIVGPKRNLRGRGGMMSENVVTVVETKLDNRPHFSYMPTTLLIRGASPVRAD
jgi:hypothetical protein